MRAFWLSFIFLVTLGANACADETSVRAEKAIAKQTPKIEAQLESSSTQIGNPVFIRIVKTVDGSLKDGYLELFLANEGGEFERYKKWPICTSPAIISVLIWVIRILLTELMAGPAVI